MVNDLEIWQREREAELNSPSSWLGLIGLFWLQPGVNRVGSAEGAAVVLPAGPSELGDIVWEADCLVWQPAGGEHRAELALHVGRARRPIVRARAPVDL